MESGRHAHPACPLALMHRPGVTSAAIAYRAANSDLARLAEAAGNRPVTVACRPCSPAIAGSGNPERLPPAGRSKR